jgi:class 3 adenylate cyclase
MTENIRMLAAIMFTDMVGFTALMQENEEKAKTTVICTDETEEEINDHQGRIPYYGDGALQFSGRDFAVNCAVKVQQFLQRNLKFPSESGCILEI